MCRKTQLQGMCILGFGLGLLVGCCIEAGFWCCVLGIGTVICGFVQMQKK